LGGIDLTRGTKDNFQEQKTLRNRNADQERGNVSLGGGKVDQRQAMLKA